jgi:hypothetical protein
VTYRSFFGGPDRARIEVLGAYEDGSSQAIEAGVERISFILQLRNDKTIGEGSCAGCNTGVCIVLNRTRILLASGGAVEIVGPLDRNWVTWRGGQGNCPGATPARRSTWGLLKATYR